MKRIAIVLSAFVLMNFMTQAQTVSSFSQYLQNPYMQNQAFAGVQDYFEISTAYRKQWTGISNAPQLGYVSFFGPIGKPKKRTHFYNTLRTSRIPTKMKRKLFHGVGGFLSLNSSGAFRNTKGKLSYAVHLPVTRDITISFSPSAGVSNSRFDQNKADAIEKNDQTLENYLANAKSKTYFDMNFGTWIYTENAFVGFAIEQILQNELSTGSLSEKAKLPIQQYITGGYKFRPTREIFLTPSAMLRLTQNSPVTWDLNMRLDYLDKFWAGCSYRHNNSLVIMFGAHINDLIKIGYSFDYSTTEIKQYSSGSHEIFLGISLGKASFVK